MPFSQGGSSGSSAISGVTVTGSAVAGDVPVASSSSAGAWALPPGYEFGYDQITSGVNIASTTEATGTALISCAAHTFDGAPVMCQVFGFLTGSSTATIMQISLFESSTQIGRMFQYLIGTATTSDVVMVNAMLRFTPTAASHTYTVTGFSNNSTGTQAIFSGGAGGTGVINPAFCRFTKV